MPANARCAYLKEDGGRCRAKPLHDSTFCFFHDPETAAKRDAARKAGGVERSRRAAVLPADTPDRPLTTAAEVGRLLADTINQTLRGQVDPRVSNNIGYLAGILVKVLAQTDVEQRVARLEKVIASQRMPMQAEAVEFVSPGVEGYPDGGDDVDDDYLEAEEAGEVEEEAGQTEAEVKEEASAENGNGREGGQQ